MTYFSHKKAYHMLGAAALGSLMMAGAAHAAVYTYEIDIAQIDGRKEILRIDLIWVSPPSPVTVVKAQILR